MKILDSYWTNYEAPGTVDRKTHPPVLNFDLVKKINGRHGFDPEPFEWKGQIIHENNELQCPVSLECGMNVGNDEIHCSSSSLAGIYHKSMDCVEGTTYTCKVNVFGKSLQIFNCDNIIKRSVLMAGTEEEKQLFDQAQRFGMAVDTLFTTRGQVTEETDAKIDKLAYFCVFAKDMDANGKFTLNIRKEVDIMLKLKKSYLPIELKTRTWLGMSKKALYYQLLPSLITRCYLTDCFTVMIAVRDGNGCSSISKVLYIEDIRDICVGAFNSRRQYFRFFFRQLIKHRQELTAIEYTSEYVKLKSENNDITGNLDHIFRPLNPYLQMSSLKPDLVICPDSEFDDLMQTLPDVCTLKKYPYESAWSLSQTTITYILAWRFESLLELLMKHSRRLEAFLYGITVFMPNLEDTPIDEEIEVACKAHCGENLVVNVHLFEDIEDLEQEMKALDLFENCFHAMVLLGAGISLPVNFAVRCTDIFHIHTFPRKEILEIVTIPEKIAVFGTCAQCVTAKEKMAELPMFEGFEDQTFYFLMDTEVVPNMNFTHMYFVTEHTDMLELFKETGLPFSL